MVGEDLQRQDCCLLCVERIVGESTHLHCFSGNVRVVRELHGLQGEGGSTSSEPCGLVTGTSSQATCTILKLQNKLRVDAAVSQ